ncbi:uncharacterized membrane protein YgdD (TMEM256/DUF423 family) [Scopulibacillus darangshiensis]|uniref:Uncharacterized membrane protein YgdD (TMEM256/DUF423 family) n=1 Tax=Scopulibacillus darangshiensis TaxID=442528 RepID=A0A4R2NID6_9BACL|nr:DUF423 domain-containing protein [Scopulibacillus darangshiensis]TCP20955.1 uncharacterized membrane protein YgdD (TMEM256/DUF423 family) [Scopulibacillus darangshiensis]
MGKVFVIIGAICAFLSVAIGAFGAHGLKDKLNEHYMSIFETGVQYQMMHALGLVLIGILANTMIRGESGLLNWAGWLMLAGIVIFSGSLYLLSITKVSILGAITPIGGVAFLVSWLLVVIAFVKN